MNFMLILCMLGHWSELLICQWGWSLQRRNWYWYPANAVQIRCKCSTDTLQMQYRYIENAHCLNIKLWRLSTSFFTSLKNLNYVIQSRFRVVKQVRLHWNSWRWNEFHRPISINLVSDEQSNEYQKVLIFIHLPSSSPDLMSFLLCWKRCKY